MGLFLRLKASIRNGKRSRSVTQNSVKYGENSVKYGKEREIFYQISHCFAVFDAVLRYLTPYRPPKSPILEEIKWVLFDPGGPALKFKMHLQYI